MFRQIEEALTRAVSAHLQARYGADIPVLVEQPKQTSFGELALPAAFQLARQLRQAPRAIAQQLSRTSVRSRASTSWRSPATATSTSDCDRAYYGDGLLHRRCRGRRRRRRQKIIVEHTNINPNKAAHIGHLRNAVLGDTFVRMLRANGQHVEVQNYIDNTGVQVADVVVGFHQLEHKTPQQVQQLIESGDRPFDYYCWDLYARISAHYKTNPTALRWRADTLHAIEAGEGVEAELAHMVADAIVQAHLRTMLRLGVEYDVLPRESEILHLKFWAKAFELLKERRRHSF